jgi:2-polyprenyl-3-methyl-5-hydroxy-6-metoxy-1,4-benzoquinol methylase
MAAKLKDSEYVQSDNKNLFEIFSYKSDVDWPNAKILDFGSNIGNFVKNAGNNIKAENYLGIDLNENSIKLAKELHPNYNFVHYNKWHSSFNPNGVKNLNAKDVIDLKFDVIIAYSVFTHTSVEETESELAMLKQMLTPNGKILFTIWTDEIFEHFYNFAYNKYDKSLTPIDFSTLTYDKYVYWVDYEYVIKDEYSLNHPCELSLCTFYKLEVFKKLFPYTRLLGTREQVNIENHHQTLFVC